MIFPSFSALHFVIAGVLCAVGPVLIHLLNRQRYRVVEWAAMDFLREAMQRNRRILQIRDLLLLLLRVLAVLLFGFALGQPFWATQPEELTGKQPVHAVLIVDNSMSMGYEAAVGTTLLDLARFKAKEFIEELPAGSVVSVIPACGSTQPFSSDPFSTPQQAADALDRIQVVDRTASAALLINEARRAANRDSQLSQRIVILGDQQKSNWSGAPSADQLEDLPPIQVVNVVPTDIALHEANNSWVNDLYIQDGIADVETPTTIVALLRHQGQTTREHVQVTLKVDGVEAASQTTSLTPSEGDTEVTFRYTFEAYQPEPGRPAMVPIEVSLTPDSLTTDDSRHVIVPVVAALPVVFIDQYGAEQEDPETQKLGETRHLRQLLAPNGDRDKQLLVVRHVRIDQVSEELLSDARLVVVAGIEEPGKNVDLLREYVQQGGPLVVAAGADFDPQRWNEQAWLEGEGILPLPLKPDPVGTLPEDATSELKPMFLSFGSMRGHEYFQIADVETKDLEDLYSEPFFFKAIDIDDSPEFQASLEETDRERILKEIEDWSATLSDLRSLALKQDKEGLSASEEQRVANLEQQLEEMEPTWLSWEPASNRPTVREAIEQLEDGEEISEKAVQAILNSTRPEILARLQDGPPFLVERRIGKGRVLFVGSGVLSSWNTVPLTNAIVIFDRILRTLVLDTLPRRNFSPQERITLPLATGERNIDVQLQRPGDEAAIESLDAGFIGEDRLGITIHNPLKRGDYQLAAFARSEATTGETAEPFWNTTLAVNGDGLESDLVPITKSEFEERLGVENIRWVAPGEEIQIDGVFTRGQSSWWYIVLVVLGLLLVESAILAYPAFKQAAATNGGAA